jgi:predicted dehydrogenase
MTPIKTALLSFGMSGRVFHAPFLHVNKGFQLQGVWERSKTVVHEFYQGVKSYRSYDELLADESIELVVVNTPNYTHYDYAKKALLAGKQVVVEKPFTTTTWEAVELIELAAKQEARLTVYHNRRYDSDFKTVKQVLQQGLLGEVVEASLHYDRYKEELSPKLHKEAPGPGTGVLYDLGSHLIDEALQLFGLPQAVFADIRIIRPLSSVDDYFELLLYYNNLRVRLHSTYLAREPGPGYLVHGSKGSFFKSRADVQEAALQNNELPGSSGWGIEPEAERGLLHTEKDGRVVREKFPTEKGNYMEFFDALYLAIRENGPDPVPAADALQVIKIIEAARKSSGEKIVVQL